MRSLVVAAIIAVLTAAAYAQGGPGGMSGGMPGAKGRHGGQQQSGAPKRKAEERDTKSALDKLPDKKFDPWQNMREAPQPK